MSEVKLSDEFNQPAENAKISNSAHREREAEIEISLSQTLRLEAQYLRQELSRLRDEFTEARLKSEQLRSDLSKQKKQLLAGKL